MTSIFNDDALDISGESQTDIGLSHQEDDDDEASINVSVVSDEPIFYDINKVTKHYMISTFSKKINKLAKAPLEGINLTLYSPKAFYNGFQTTKECLPYWIQGMHHFI